MCQSATTRLRAALFGLALAAGMASAQGPADWRKIGPSAADLMLASPATGPVAQVWFSPQGSTLYARTRAGIFWTADFETWSPAPAGTVVPAPNPTAAVRSPEPAASMVSPVAGGATVFALGRNLYRSQDGGRSWTNLTANGAHPVIGAGQRSVAVSPSDPAEVVVANDFGVWRSMDGGMTWAGLNELLPNLPVRRILSTPSGTSGTRIQVENWPGALEMPPGGAVWIPAKSPSLETEEAWKQRLSAALDIPVTAVAIAGDTVYAGSSDGRIWFSNDGGATLTASRLLAGATGPVERIYADAAEPRAALAAMAGEGAHVLRTFNGGAFWDAMDSDLPNVPAHAVTADPAAGAVYVATDAGVFSATMDLRTAGSPPHWTALSDGLPQAPAYDVALDPSAVRLYAAIDGYGVYAAAAPHRRRSLRIINAADFSTRPAAPGSLLSVVGARVNAARGGNLDYPVLGLPSDGESQIQVPYGASGPAVSLALQTSAGPVRVDLPMQPVSPAIFVGPDGAPMLYDSESGLPLDGRNPARPGGRLQIFATGLGRVAPDWPAGVPTPLQGTPHAVTAAVKAFLDGASIPVIRAALAPGYIGWYIIEVQLPPVVNYGGAQLLISADGQESNRVQLVIEP